MTGIVKEIPGIFFTDKRDTFFREIVVNVQNAAAGENFLKVVVPQLLEAGAA